MLFPIVFLALCHYVSSQCQMQCNPAANSLGCPIGYSCVNGCCSSVSGGCSKDEDCNGTGFACYYGTCSCKPNYLLVNGQCVKAPKLGEKCFDGQQNTYVYNGGCLAAYSNCSNGVCQCQPGFVRRGNTENCTRIRTAYGKPCKADLECSGAYTYCGPTKTCGCRPGCFTTNKQDCTCGGFNCPVGSVQTQNGRAVECAVSYNSFQMREEDTCGDGFVCATDPTKGGFDKGFCCPKLKSSCPYTSAEPATSVGGCPMTHNYYFDRVTGRSLCCPSPCALEDVFANGQCYPRVTAGAVCQVNEQCPYSSICSPTTGGTKKCVCVNGTMQYSSYCAVPFCTTPGSFAQFTPTGRVVNCSSATPCQKDYQCQKEPFGICCSDASQQNPNCLATFVSCNANNASCPVGYTCNNGSCCQVTGFGG